MPASFLSSCSPQLTANLIVPFGPEDTERRLQYGTLSKPAGTLSVRGPGCVPACLAEGEDPS